MLQKTQLLAYEQLETLKDGRVPTQLPPFKMAYKNEILEEEFLSSGDPPTVLSYSLAPGQSFAECKRKIYLEFLSANAKLDVEVSKRQALKQRSDAGYDKFLETCREPLQVHRNAFGSVKDFVGGQSIDAVDYSELLEAEAHAAYVQLLDSLALQHLKSEKLKQKQIALDQKQRENAAALTPLQVLEHFVDDRVGENGGRKGKKKKEKLVDGTELDYGAMLTPSLIEVTPVYGHPNVESPVAGGRVQQPRSKPQARPKSKAKAKASPKAKPKGKGKGKPAAEGRGAGKKGAGRGGASSKSKGKGKSKNGKGKGS